MDFLLKLLGEQWTIGAAQLILGRLVKPQLAGKISAAGIKYSAVIPLLNLILAYAGFTILPASAHAAGLLAGAVGVGQQGLSVFSLAVLQTVLISGTHSTLKNTVVPAAKVTLGWLFNKLTPWLSSR